MIMERKIEKEKTRSDARDDGSEIETSVD